MHTAPDRSLLDPEYIGDFFDAETNDLFQEQRDAENRPGAS